MLRCAIFFVTLGYINRIWKMLKHNCRVRAQSYFFEPWIGRNYEDGFKGVKTLVVGVCHICTRKCEFRGECNSAESVRACDFKCPEYSNCENVEYYRLHNSNDIEITSFIDGDAAYPTYKLFTYYMLKCAGDLSSEKKRELWDHVAFTNYLQFFHDDNDALPVDAKLYEDAYPAFCEVVRKVDPEIVCVWSEAIKECLKLHKNEFAYIGKADLSIGVPIYIFLPNNSKLTGTRLGRLRYRLGIQSENHRLGWYRKLLKKHLEKCIGEQDADKGKTINRLAQNLMTLVGDGLIGATEDHLYFRDTDRYRWTSQLKGFFLISVNRAYPTFGRGFNPGMEAIFGERMATNRRNPNESVGPEGRIVAAIRRFFPTQR